MSDAPTTPVEELTGVILAGGRATRMGGQDKGLIELDGRPMIDYILRRLKPQCGHLLINANRNQIRYAELGSCPVVEDAIDGFAGPLAGIATAMQRVESTFVLTVPCDSPLIAPDLAQRLYQCLACSQADICVAHDGVRMQPVFALLRTALVSSLLDYLRSGQRKIDTWYARHHCVECDLSDRAETFWNINTPEERDRLEAEVRAERW